MVGIGVVAFVVAVLLFAFVVLLFVVVMLVVELGSACACWFSRAPARLLATLAPIVAEAHLPLILFNW